MRLVPGVGAQPAREPDAATASGALPTALLAGSAPALAESTDHALEPAINGEVSASGPYPTQALEDAAHGDS
jgi:hypothetical protein